jgi:hypothetical protein
MTKGLGTISATDYQTLAEAGGVYAGEYLTASEVFLGAAIEVGIDVQARISELEAALKYIAEHASLAGFRRTDTHENATLISEFARAALGDGA